MAVIAFFIALQCYSATQQEKKKGDFVALKRDNKKKK
jgi:hypothetical protein